jgi:hypothetical protein
MPGKECGRARLASSGDNIFIPYFLPASIACDVSEIGDGIGRDVHAGRALGHALEVAVQGGRLFGGGQRDDQRSEYSDRI